MELYQLEYFLAVARHKNFTRAAEEMCVSQSTLSQQVKKLEDEVGVKLFDRTTHLVLPTAAGQDLLAYAKMIVDTAGAALQSLYGYGKLTRGTLTIGSVRTAEFTGFIDLVTSFHSRFPGINLRIVQGGSYKITELLRAGEIDVGIVFRPLDDGTDDVEYQPLADCDSVLLAAESHRLAGRKTVDLKEVAGEDFIFPTTDQSIYHLYKKACRDAGFSPRIVCESGSCETSLALVRAGMGLAILPYDVIKGEKPSAIAAVKLASPIRTTVALALLKRPYHSPPATAFREHALATGLARPAGE